MLAGLFAAGVLAVPGASAHAATAGDDFRLLDPRITESSGLAPSHRHPHTVWTTNDSGDGARIFAVDTRTGRTTGVHTYGAPVRDVEALAITPQGRVLVGDLGDNTGTRSVVRVFWFDEPGLGDTSGGWASWELAYPDGPHDAESLAVDPRSGRVHIVTKGPEGAVYALPREPSRDGVNRLTRVGPAPAVATDAVYLADGSGLLVRTYTQLVRLDPTTFSEVSSSWLPLQRQGEPLALDPDGPGLLVGSEGRGSLVQHVDVPAPAGTGPVTSTPATPPATTPTTTQTTAPASLSTTATPPTATASKAVVAPARPDVPPVSGRQVLLGATASVGLVVFALLSTWLARRAARGNR